MALGAHGRRRALYARGRGHGAGERRVHRHGVAGEEPEMPAGPVRVLTPFDPDAT